MMKGNKDLRFVSIFVLIQFFLFPTAGKAFDDRAHITLSRRATEISTLDTALKSNLSFEFFNGKDVAVFNGRSVIELIEDGSVDEDRPILWRPRHHFHNPRLNWDEAGWQPPPLSVQFGESSVIWSQDSNQSVGGKHSWHDARDTYFQALTAMSKSERERLYGETFKSLGHLIHLVQDAAVPSHTRNDSHLNYKGIGDPDAFHGWAEGQEATIAGTNPLPFNTSLLNQTNPNAFAPLPISRIIDSTDGDIGSWALTPGADLGIAEYSSANFYSDDTVNSPSFQFPLPAQVEVRAPEPDATGTRLRRYVYFRSGFGEQDYPLAVASALAPYVLDPIATPTESGLDDKVFTGYGAKLFPRAIGSSAGLIDYFFRGQIDSVGPGFVLVPWEQRPTSISVSGVKIVVPGGGEQTGAGTMRLVLLHRNHFTGEPQGDLSPGPTPPVVTSNEIPFIISSQTQTVTFPFATDLPFPTTAPPPELGCCYGHMYMGIIVYRGTLGQETNNAVVASGYCAASGEKWERYYSFERSTVDAYIGEC
jgi:hypothetical protein